MSDLKDFLESIRKHSDKVGETAMRQVREFAFLTPLPMTVKMCLSTNLSVCVSVSVSLGTAAQDFQQCSCQTGQYGPLHQACVLFERTNSLSHSQRPDDK